jgi:group I intron endonuclease
VTNSGIYKIVNKINGKAYYGSSIDLKNRLNKHKNDLKNNKHDNFHLQNAYNKYGIEAFEFIIIELIEKPKNMNNDEFKRFLQKEHEQPYLDKHWDNHKNCYNDKKNATGGRNCGFKQSQETKDKISASKQNISDETRRKIGIAHKGKIVSNATRELLSKNNLGKKLSNNKSGFCGVYFNKREKKFKTQIRINGKQIHLGYFKTAEEASIAYQNKLKELTGVL